jgi:hypothetical protein
MPWNIRTCCRIRRRCLAWPTTSGDAYADTQSLLEGIVGNTHEHYDEHRAWIDALLSQITDQGL